MHVITARNVNSAYAQGLHHMAEVGEYADSRNGAVLVAPTPVTTVYQRPTERVIFCPLRDANPFFHLMEALWMMAGRRDVAWPSLFNSRFVKYSDDGATLHGAYGHRWRHFFGVDQVDQVIAELRSNPQSRRCVLAMWSPFEDLGMEGKDLPCNTHVYFAARGGRLDMTVCNRSNDIVWGAYGANAVHMSMLHELVAHAAGCEVGTYYQVSNNYHLYTDVVSAAELRSLAESAALHDYYAQGRVATIPLIGTNYADWMADLHAFLDYWGAPDWVPAHMPVYRNSFFATTATPMIRAWWQRKNKWEYGSYEARNIKAPDWQLACTQWILRRKQ